jgi:glycosyltransferase involved in cell wall biosynthesis
LGICGVALLAHNTDSATESEARTILFVGCLSEEKGIETLVKAMSLVVRAEPYAILVIVGDGVLRSVVRRLIEKEELDNQVLMVGAVPHDQVTKYFLSASIPVFQVGSRL